MTEDSTLLTQFEERVGPSITFGDDRKGYTMGYGLILKENVIIDYVALVDGLKHNFLSISQLCDKGNEVWFIKGACVIYDLSTGNILLTENRKGNVYVVEFNSTNSKTMTCLLSKASSNESWLWHKKLSHLNFKVMNLLVKKNFVRGVPKLEFTKDGLSVKRKNKERHHSRARQNHQLMYPCGCFIWIYLDQATSCLKPKINIALLLLRISQDSPGISFFTLRMKKVRSLSITSGLLTMEPNGESGK